jgi:hypothetical protein
MTQLYTVASVFNTILIIAGLVGGFFAFRNGVTRTANEIQERAINALQAEIETLKTRLADLHAQNSRQEQIITLICEALKSRGLIVTIDGTLINIKDGSGGSVSTRIKEEI